MVEQKAEASAAADRPCLWVAVAAAATWTWDGMLPSSVMREKEKEWLGEEGEKSCYNHSQIHSDPFQGPKTAFE